MVKIRYFEITMLVVIILQNGFLKNLPALLLMIPIMLGLIQSNWKLKTLNSREALVLLYGGYLLFISIINVKNLYNPVNVINIFIQYLLIFLSVHICYDKVKIDRFFFSYRNIGVVLSLLCIVEQISRIHFFDIVLGKGGMYSEYAYRVSSIFGHPILCGVFLVILLLTLLYFPYKNIFFQYIAVVVTIAAILFTQSRSSWIATIVTVFLYWIKKRKIAPQKLQKNEFLFFLSFVIPTLAIFISLFFSYLNHFFMALFVRVSGSLDAGEGHIVRIENILNSINFWNSGHHLQLIFGSGKNAGLLFLISHPVSKFGGLFVWNSALDNQYLTIVHESGIIGLILFLLMLVDSLMTILKSEDKTRLLINSSLLSINIVLFFFEGLDYVTVVLFLVFLYVVDNKEVKNKGEVEIVYE